MRRMHEMPFGAQRLPTGDVRFRLWAPGADNVRLHVPSSRSAPNLLMPRCDDGWFENLVGDVHAGARYSFEIDGGLRVPDPASRFNADDVHGPSVVVDPLAFEWRDADWQGRPWEEVVLYELHVGSFSPEGTYAGVEKRLPHLRDLGVTALELMPIADFPGRRNWGYDGVLPYAPEASYGTPEDLKRLVQAAHHHGLMIFLDVVYNHFGPDGNYLHAYAPAFFTERHQTPWGAAINFDGDGSAMVREFFIHNALYWIEEYAFDGLRLDAVHAIADDSKPDILETLGARVRAGPGRHRHVHLVLEDDRNLARYLRRDQAGSPTLYNAQWNDDAHHAMHVLATGEGGGYYADYSERPAQLLGRCLAEGYAYQGDASRYRNGAVRGEVSAHLPLTAFVNFLQNHDQVGNRAFGDRIATLGDPDALMTLTALLLLSPSIPLLFMGQEWGSLQPFPFFCDFNAELAPKVTQGRREEFARFPQFADPAVRDAIPDPNAAGTFESARLDWRVIENKDHGHWLSLHRRLLQLRRDEIVPRLAGADGGRARYRMLSNHTVQWTWPLSGGGELGAVARLGETGSPALPALAGRALFVFPRPEAAEAGHAVWSVAFHLRDALEESQGVVPD